MKDYVPMKTGEIREIMNRRGVSFADLAEEIGVEENRIEQILCGYQYLSDNNAIMIMDALSRLKEKRKVSKKTL